MGFGNNFDMTEVQNTEQYMRSEQGPYLYQFFVPPSSSIPIKPEIPHQKLTKMRSPVLQGLFLFSLAFTLVAAVNGDSEVVQVSGHSAMFDPESDQI